MAEELCCIPVLIKYPKSRLAMLGSHFCCASDLFSHVYFEVSRAQDLMGCRQVRAGAGRFKRERSARQNSTGKSPDPPQM